MKPTSNYQIGEYGQKGLHYNLGISEVTVSRKGDGYVARLTFSRVTVFIINPRQMGMDGRWGSETSSVKYDESTALNNALDGAEWEVLNAYPTWLQLGFCAPEGYIYLDLDTVEGGVDKDVLDHFGR